ncbi:Nif3-like dinuclear metal center hexameric protein [Pseudoflavonifractor sp. 60]|uniref:Nif3-like dinuclear metal center hexameric protein n=1 Tax=Pseudoflavonifractor sp. 60 TaxID=2304576 RepID=UPI00137025FA|nr:Nif3-like dinuclear metal center hexameric protein [Pseudoflavonifractor sp. 60]
MAAVKDIYQFMDQIAPFATQEDFDNAGFLVGRRDRAVTKILVALDITLEVAREAAQAGAELIVSHHPVIFHPVKSVTDESPVGRVLLALAENQTAAICAHTNLDAAHGGVNGCLARILELSDIGQLCQAGVDEQGRPYGIGRVGTVHRPGLSAEEYAAFVKEKLGSASVRFVDGGKPVGKVAVGGGACGSMMEDALAAGCDTFVTADLKYNNFLDARDLGLNLMDAGHFPTENVVCAPLVRRLAETFPEVTVVLSRVHREIYSAV